MSKVIHCRINMFDRNVNFILEDENEVITNLKEKIPIANLAEYLPGLAQKYGVTKFHLIGSLEYVKGVAAKLKKSNLNFSHYEIEVN